MEERHWEAGSRHWLQQLLLLQTPNPISVEDGCQIPEEGLIARSRDRWDAGQRSEGQAQRC